MSTADDLTALFGPDPAGASQDMRFRQGIVQSWDPLTATNTVLVGNTVLVNVPVFNTSEALLLTAGDVVSIGVIGDAGGARTYGIWGRMVIPNTPSAATALSAIRAYSDTIDTSETTTSAVFTDLATPGPTLNDVLIGTSGRALVMIGAQVGVVAPGGSSINTGDALMGFDVTGATTLPVASNPPMEARIRYDDPGTNPTSLDIRVAASRVVLLEGMNSGLHTFTAKYQSQNGTTATFIGRNLTVISL